LFREGARLSFAAHPTAAIDASILATSGGGAVRTLCTGDALDADFTSKTRDIFVIGLRNAHAMENEALSSMKPQLSRIENYPQVAAPRPAQSGRSATARQDCQIGRA
jgi:hypothetical protein